MSKPGMGTKYSGEVPETSDTRERVVRELLGLMGQWTTCYAYDGSPYLRTTLSVEGPDGAEIEWAMGAADRILTALSNEPTEGDRPAGVRDHEIAFGHRTPEPTEGQPVVGEKRREALAIAEKVAQEYGRQTHESLNRHVLVEALGAAGLWSALSPEPTGGEKCTCDPGEGGSIGHPPEQPWIDEHCPVHGRTPEPTRPEGEGPSWKEIAQHYCEERDAMQEALADANGEIRRLRQSQGGEEEDVVEWLRRKADGAEFSAQACEAILGSAALHFAATVLASANDSPLHRPEPTERGGDE